MVMSTRSLIRCCSSLAVFLTLSGSAVARQPPALTRGQAASTAIAATCPGDPGPGYRDALARFQSRDLRAEIAPKRREFVQKMGDHVVISCKGGQLHAGAGYRDMIVRFQTEGPEVPIEQMTAAR
jgi:hypothetical protein